jgi:Protein of unknown function (DUF3352)
MKKNGVILLALVLLAFGLSSCAKATAPQAGSAQAKDLLSLLPADSKGVIVIDVGRLMQTAAVTKAIAENEDKAKYDEFIQTTGIDPQKDVFYFVGATMGELGQKDMEGVGLVNLKYQKEKILALIQKERGELTTEEYSGLTIYKSAATGEKKALSGIFLDESNILFGTDVALKKVVDVRQKKADNVWKSEALSALLKGMNTSALVWGAFSVPQETMKQASSQNPMLGAFSDIRSLIMSFDYKDKNILAEIKAMSPDEAKNKQMADALSGFKALGAGAAAKEPLLGELLNKIVIDAAPDHVKISANIPEELIENLSQKMKVKKAEPETEPQKD